MSGRLYDPSDPENFALVRARQRYLRAVLVQCPKVLRELKEDCLVAWLACAIPGIGSRPEVVSDSPDLTTTIDIQLYLGNWELLVDTAKHNHIAKALHVLIENWCSRNSLRESFVKRSALLALMPLGRECMFAIAKNPTGWQSIHQHWSWQFDRAPKWIGWRYWSDTSAFPEMQFEDEHVYAPELSGLNRGLSPGMTEIEADREIDSAIEVFRARKKREWLESRTGLEPAPIRRNKTLTDVPGEEFLDMPFHLAALNRVGPEPLTQQQIRAKLKMREIFRENGKPWPDLDQSNISRRIDDAVTEAGLLD